MKTYFSHVMMVTASNVREFYAEEFLFGNNLHKAHKRFGQVFATKDICEDAIYKLIQKEGGRLIPRPEGKGGVRSRPTNYKGNR